MARVKIEPLDKTTLIWMKNYYATLSEKDQRRFAAIESRRMGYGGIEYISRVLGCTWGHPWLSPSGLLPLRLSSPRTSCSIAGIRVYLCPWSKKKDSKALSKRQPESIIMGGL